jgi:histidinol phosphatase-like enzyme
MFVWEGQEGMGRKYFNSSEFLYSNISIQNFEEEI